MLADKIATFDTPTEKCVPILSTNIYQHRDSYLRYALYHIHMSVFSKKWCIRPPKSFTVRYDMYYQGPPDRRLGGRIQPTLFFSQFFWQGRQRSPGKMSTLGISMNQRPPYPILETVRRHWLCKRMMVLLRVQFPNITENCAGYSLGHLEMRGHFLAKLVKFMKENQ